MFRAMAYLVVAGTALYAGAFTGDNLRPDPHAQAVRVRTIVIERRHSEPRAFEDGGVHELVELVSDRPTALNSALLQSACAIYPKRLRHTVKGC